jgi:hypothetical protein
VADPNRLATLLPHLVGVTAVCWLLGSARGEPEAIQAVHGDRLRSLLEHLVDTPVRGFVYEGAGDVAPTSLEQGARHVRDAAVRYRMPAEVVEAPPGDGWLDAMTAACGRALGGL